MGARGPAWTTKRENPLVIEHDGRTFRLWVESGGVATGGTARISNPHWLVEVDGVQRLGWPTTPDGSEAIGDVRYELERWWTKQRRSATQ